MANIPWLDAVVDSPWFLGVLLLIVLVAILVPPSPPLVVPELPETLDLPPRVTGFVGRQDELHRIRVAARHETVVAVVGERGVGTSALLSVAAHELRGAYPDGQVYLDVRGGHRHPLTPEQVLGRVCHRLKLPVISGTEPGMLDDAAAWLRTWLVEHQVLLVLDNVDDPDLVSALLPESGRSLVLLAGGTTLARLAHCVPLRLLSDAEGVVLLRRDDPPQLVGGDHASARRLVRLCGHQPLAIRLLRAQLKQGQRAPDSLANTIEKALPDQSEHHSATALSRLQAVCDLAYGGLTWQCGRMFRLLALVPGTEIDIRAAAVLAGVDRKTAGETLGELAKLEFVESVPGQRYRLRHLLDPTARTHLKVSETPVSQRRAQARLVAHLAVIAEQQADALMLAASEGQDRAVTRGQANAWFGWEHDLLYGLVTDCLTDISMPQLRRLRRGSFKIASALCQWYATESRLYADWRRVAETIRDSPVARPDRSVVAWAHNELAVVHRLRGDPGAASRELTAARELLPYRQRAVRTQVLTNLGLVQIDQRHVQEAVGTLEAARMSRGDRRGRALTDVALSAAHLYGDNPHLARLHADECLRRLSGRDGTLSSNDAGELRIVAAGLNNLGLALWQQGDHLSVTEHWDKAYEIYSELGDAAGKARVLLNKAMVLLSRDPARLDEAIAGLRESLMLRGAGPVTVGTGLCHLHLGHAYALRSDFVQACTEWRMAWEVFDQLDLQPEAEEARRLLGEHGCGELPRRPPRTPERPDEPRGWLDRLLSWWQRSRRVPRPDHW